MVSDVARTLLYPVAGETAERPLLAGWILVLLGFVVPVLPLVPFLGYLVRVLVRSAAGDAGSPSFLRDGRSLVRVGIGASVVCAVYLVIPAVLLLVTVYGIVESPRVPRGFGGTLVFVSGTTVVLVLSLLASYLLPVALTAYGRERRLGAAFEYSTLFTLGRSLDVLVAWAVVLVIAAVGGAVALTLLGFPRFGPVLAALVLAYVAILGSHYLGRGIARAER